MTINQMATIKRWHQTHDRARGLEYQVWDAMLTCWVLGWVGLPAAVVLAPEIGIVSCLGAYMAPSLYVALRRRLHRAGVLRCDWLTVGQP